MNRVSVNADCQALGSNRQRFIDFIVALRPPYVVLMDDNKCEIADAIHARAPEVTFIHRKFTIHDGNLHRVPQDDGSMLSPQEYLDFLKTHKRPYVIHQVFNEPAPPKGEMVRLLDWLCELMDLAYQQNMRLCTLNMQTVAIRFDELDAGVYDKYLFKCAQYAAFHIAGAHEYALGDVELNVSNDFMLALVNKDRASSSAWRHVKPREAHIGRIQIVVDRMKHIGATPTPSFVMTEYGDDKVEIAEYQDVMGRNGGKQPLGIPSLATYWQWRYNITVLEGALAQFHWTNDVFPDYVKGFCWFGWNYNPEWAGFNVGELVDLQREWILYADRVRFAIPPPVDDEPDVPTETFEQETRRRLAALEARVSKIEADLKAVRDGVTSFEAWKQSAQKQLDDLSGDHR